MSPPLIRVPLREDGCPEIKSPVAIKHTHDYVYNLTGAATSPMNIKNNESFDMAQIHTRVGSIIKSQQNFEYQDKFDKSD